VKQVLLIEPDYLLADVYKQALETEDIRVAVAYSAQSAIFEADKKTPDLVVLEIQLTEHSGIEFLYEFRSYQEWQAIPVIVQSQVPPAEFNHSWQILKEELGVETYLYKPHTSIRALVNKVKEVSLDKTRETAFN
jgi:DNA-binding response OmpR family regulator